MSGPTGPFGYADRLLHRRDFRRVDRQGRRAALPGLVVLAARRPGPESRLRLGLTMSRRVGGAVVRNRLKRQVREWFRRERGRLAGGVDLVVIGRSAARGRSSAEVWRMLDRAVAELGLAR